MITTLDAPPYTIDPDVLSPFDARQTVFGRRNWDESADFYGLGVHDRAAQILSASATSTDATSADAEAGYSRLEFARLRASWTVSDQFHGAYAWDKLGGPDATLGSLPPHPVDDPALASEQVKATARTYGADGVGVCALDRRWLYTHQRNGDAIELPEAVNRAVVMAIHMDPEGISHSPDFRAGTATGVGYSRMAYAIACLAEFLRYLGYRALPMGNDSALSIPLAIDAGLGELGRNGLLLTPQYGSCVRLCKVLTDMPLAPDKPISFGVQEVCVGCRRCAEGCAAGAISTAEAPSYEVVCPSNNRGIRRWAVNHDKCYQFWVENGASCSTCIAACPFTR